MGVCNPWETWETTWKQPIFVEVQHCVAGAFRRQGLSGIFRWPHDRPKTTPQKVAVWFREIPESPAISGNWRLVEYYFIWPGIFKKNEIHPRKGCPAGSDRNDRDRKLGYFTYLRDVNNLPL